MLSYVFLFSFFLHYTQSSYVVTCHALNVYKLSTISLSIFVFCFFDPFILLCGVIFVLNQRRIIFQLLIAAGVVFCLVTISVACFLTSAVSSILEL